MHEVLLNTTNNLAREAMKEYWELRGNGRITDVQSYMPFPGENVLAEALEKGTAHNILLSDNKFVGTNLNIDIFSPAVQIYGLSRVKETLLIKEGNSNLSWQDYKNKTCAALAVLGELGSQEIGTKQEGKNILAEILSKDSPFSLAFQNAVNYVCEELNLDPLFTKAKRTQELRQALKNITGTVKIDNPLEEEKPEPKSLGT